jgi:8-oxo-dGTP pyrophosphatase MutT (NUDIX family)
MEERATARLVLLDSSSRVLLMRIVLGDDPADELWVTLGGGIEPGESVLSAARRELDEETGITDAQVGPVVWYGEQVLKANGAPRLLKESFVLVRRADPAQTDATLTDDGWTAEERRVIAEMRWWSVPELSATSKTIKPPELASLLSELLRSMDSGSVDSAGVRTIDLQ